MFTQASAHIGRLVIIVGLGGSLVAGTFPALGMADESTELKSIRMTCGSCSDGYATTGVTQSAESCKGGAPTLVACVPLEATMRAICDSYLEGHAEIGWLICPGPLWQERRWVGLLVPIEENGRESAGSQARGQDLPSGLRQYGHARAGCAAYSAQVSTDT